MKNIIVITVAGNFIRCNRIYDNLQWHELCCETIEQVG